MKQVLAAIFTIACLSGCTTKHQCISGDPFAIPIEFDKFTRSFEPKDISSFPVKLKPECITYFETHPDIKSDKGKITLIPLASYKGEVKSAHDRFEYDMRLSILLGLQGKVQLQIAFDPEGKPTDVGHIKMSRLWRLWNTRSVEFDFKTETAAGKNRYIFNAFGEKRTHSGKKWTYMFWIPFQTSDGTQTEGASASGDATFGSPET